MLHTILKKAVALLCAATVIMSLPFFAAAEEKQATEISGADLVTDSSGVRSTARLFDKVVLDESNLGADARITLSHEAGIGSLYLIFSLEFGSYTVINEDTGEKHTWGETGFLHEFLDLEAVFGTAPTSVTLDFTGGKAKLNEIYAFTSGEVPDFVQKWELPKDGKTDLVLFSTHGDDEQLFFAGLLPYYAQERDYEVQVVYLTDHRNITLRRTGEMLNGLWAVGIRNYPVFGSFQDLESKSKKEAYDQYYRRDITDEKLIGFVVEQLRRFHPKVAVGHDVNGEYGHGMHMLYTDVLMKALEISNDPSQYPELAEAYGVWDVPKTYIHMYEENPIWMDWDQPLDSFGGMTAFEVSKKLGFPAHATQKRYFSWYYDGINSAADIPRYNPCEYGLYRSTVGQDVQKNDMFENLISHAEDAALEQARLEEQTREEEAARLAAEEQARLEAEAARQTEPPQETTQLVRESQEKAVIHNSVWLLISAAAVLLTVVLFLLVLIIKRR